jgi:GAF domain-containing protein
MEPRLAALKRAADLLKPHKTALLACWVEALGRAGNAPATDLRSSCARTLDGLLDRLGRGEVEGWLRLEAEAAQAAVRAGESLAPLARAIVVFDRCCLPHLLDAGPDRDALAESLFALHELSARRIEALLLAQDEESARRLVEAQEQAARAEERARELQRSNDALRRSERQSQHRADQIGLLAEVARRISPVLDPDALMQAAASAIQARLDYTYVAVVVLDDEGVLVGRWAGRPGVGRRSGGKAQGPPGGIIGRALRRRAPQVVGDVASDPDYHADVTGTRSEMVVPLLEGGTAVGAIDFQSEETSAFDLDDVAAGEALAEFVVVALRNARLFAEARSPQRSPEDRA